MPRCCSCYATVARGDLQDVIPRSDGAHRVKVARGDRLFVLTTERTQACHDAATGGRDARLARRGA